MNEMKVFYLQIYFFDVSVIIIIIAISFFMTFFVLAIGKFSKYAVRLF